MPRKSDTPIPRLTLSEHVSAISSAARGAPKRDVILAHLQRVQEIAEYYRGEGPATAAAALVMQQQ